MKKTNWLINNLLYCGVSKQEFNSVKKDAYFSNYKVWNNLFIILTVMSVILFCSSFFFETAKMNQLVYGLLFGFFLVMTLLFKFLIKPDSLIGQVLIYLSMLAILSIGQALSVMKPNYLAVTFIVLLVILPMFMIDKPYHMMILLMLSTLVFLICTFNLKTDPIVREGDLYNSLVFTFLGIVVNIFYNSFRIKEFLLKKQIEFERDTDLLTGLLNKSSFTNEVHFYLKNDTSKAFFMILDLDDFKSFNDTYGHDIGDEVLKQFALCLKNSFRKSDIIGRFGGDEFVAYLPNTSKTDDVEKILNRIISQVNDIKINGVANKISVSIGASVSSGFERHYDELFKNADIELYKAKETGKNKYSIQKNKNSC